MRRKTLTDRFRALHVPGRPLVMPNPWDLGSAKLMAGLGAQALATTSAGHGFTLGLADGGQGSREMALRHAAELCAAADLPVNGDFENGYGDAPETVAETVRLAAEAGLAGVSIEDTAVPTTASYPFDLALARIEAAVAAAREVGIVLTARADGCIFGNYDPAEAVRRCQAFARAGAEVIYAPLLDAEATRALVATGTAGQPAGRHRYARSDGGGDGGAGRRAHLHRRGARAGRAAGDPRRNPRHPRTRRLHPAEKRGDGGGGRGPAEEMNGSWTPVASVAPSWRRLRRKLAGRSRRPEFCNAVARTRHDRP
jgi:hypothetical protein